MKQSDLFKEIIATYQKHGWQLRSLLLRTETRTEIGADSLPANAGATEAKIDALWFARAASGDREAWELRLLAETPFALFETFEKHETEEEREDVRREMEARMRDYVSGE